MPDSSRGRDQLVAVGWFVGGFHTKATKAGGGDD